jgi:transketolase
VKDQPSLIIAHTVKGKGISFIEDDNKYHGTTPSEDELARALAELQEA